MKLQSQGSHTNHLLGFSASFLAQSEMYEGPGEFGFPRAQNAVVTCTSRKHEKRETTVTVAILAVVQS